MIQRTYDLRISFSKFSDLLPASIYARTIGNL